MTCQGIKCKDYLTEEGPPAWCYRAGQPAQVAAMKCPKLGDHELKGDNLATEISRTQAMCAVAQQIIAGGRLVLDATKAADELPGVGKSRLLLE